MVVGESVLNDAVALITFGRHTLWRQPEERGGVDQLSREATSLQPTARRSRSSSESSSTCCSEIEPTWLPPLKPEPLTRRVSSLPRHRIERPVQLERSSTRRRPPRPLPNVWPTLTVLGVAYPQVHYGPGLGDHGRGRRAARGRLLQSHGHTANCRMWSAPSSPPSRKSTYHAPLDRPLSSLPILVNSTVLNAAAVPTRCVADLNGTLVLCSSTSSLPALALTLSLARFLRPFALSGLQRYLSPLPSPTRSPARAARRPSPARQVRLACLCRAAWNRALSPPCSPA